MTVIPHYPILEETLELFRIKDSKNKYNLFPRSRKDLKYIPLEYGRVLKDEDEYNNEDRNENVLGIDKNKRIFLFMMDHSYFFDNFRFTSHFGYNRDQSLKIFTNLQKLDLQGNNIITDAAIKLLTNLRELNLQKNDIITDAAIKLLTNLQELNLQENGSITDAAVKHLTNLRELNLQENGSIADAAVKHLTNLQKLNLQENNIITDAAVKHHTLTTRHF